MKFVFSPQCNKTALVRPVLVPALTVLCLPQAGSPPGSGGASFAAGPACSRSGQSPSTTSLTARHCCTSSTSRRGTSPTTAGTGTLPGGTRPWLGLVRWGRELPSREGRHRCSHLAEMLLFPHSVLIFCGDMGRGLLDLPRCVWEPNPILRPKLGATGHSVKASWEELGRFWPASADQGLPPAVPADGGSFGTPCVGCGLDSSPRLGCEGLCFSQVSRGLL